MQKHIESDSIIACPIPDSKRFQNLTGQKFARLTVQSLAGKRSNHTGGNYYFWNCHCDCGEVSIVPIAKLKNGHTKSCGCLQSEAASKSNRTHGMTETSEYSIWCAMMKRCSNSKIAQWKHYGGRGIKVCERWKKFENFISDMGLKPTPKHSIDRKDNNGNYEPGNCRWATSGEQRRNSRLVRLLTFHGETMCVTDWAIKTGINMRAILSRLSLGWSVDRALSEGVR